MTQTIAIVGLGYVGLPLAYSFAKANYKVIGFDISNNRINELENGKDSTNEIGDAISEVTIMYTQNPTDLTQADMIIVTVPTPVNENKEPDYSPLISASTSIGKIMRKGQIIVYESTVDPGTTEDLCLPLLEQYSGLSCPNDFTIGYSPERINPGDKEHTVEKIVKVVSGINKESLNIIADTYRSIIQAGVHEAPSIKVAEASKIIENTQRDINIGFMNELSKICDKLDINTFDVLEAAGTKWNFLRFSPGLVGGHCIGVDPYYLAKKAQKLGLNPELILAGRKVNDEMALYVASQVIKMLIQSGKKVDGSSVLIMGLTFKENVPDFRNSKISDVIKELKEFGANISGFDPYHGVIHDHTLHELNLTSHELEKTISGKIYDAIIYAQDHEEFAEIDILSHLNNNGVLFDIKGKFRKNGFMNYKSL